MIGNQLRIAWRKLLKNKGESTINILGLSIGMTAAVLIMLWVNNERSFDDYHADADRVYRITCHIPISKEDTWHWESSPYPLTQKAKQEIPEVEKVALIRTATYNNIIINLNGELYREKKAAWVSDEWFNVFAYDFLEGNAKAFFSTPFNIVLTQSAANRYFGKKDAVGQVLKIDTVNYMVQAVVKDNPTNSSFQFDMLMPVAALRSNPDQRNNDSEWGNFEYITFVKLKPGSKPEQVSGKIGAILDKNREKNKVTASLVPVKALRFDSEVQNSSFITINKKAVNIFAVLAVLLLIVACINYVNLTTARANLRSREVSIRKIVGAGRPTLFVQFITESLLTSVLALIITIIFVQLSLPFFNRITDEKFILPYANMSFWKIMFGTLITATILTGIYPAMLLSSFNPINVFRGNSVLKLKDVSLRKVLVVTQFTISVMLIAATIIIFNQLKYIQKQNNAYDRSQIFTFNLPYQLLMPYRDKPTIVNEYQEDVKRRLQSIAGVEMVSYSNDSPLDISSTTSGSADWDGRAKDYNPAITRLAADDNFTAMFSLQLVEGRWFIPGSNADSKNGFILNETAVKQFNIRKPWVGQRFVFQGDTGTITGVMKDFHFINLHQTIPPLVMHTGSNFRCAYFVKVNPRNIQQVLAGVEALWKERSPKKPFEYTFLEESFEKLYQTDKKISLLMTVMALIAVFISCLGLLGLAAFATEQRKKEIGIRKVLGASIHNIVTLLSKDFLLLVAISIIIGSPIAWWAMNKWLEDFAYRIDIGMGIFIAAGGITIVMTVIIVGLQGMKAAITNPVKSLRNE